MKRKNRLDCSRLSDFFGSQLFYYNEIDSTMTEAKKLIAKEVVVEQAIILADRQSGGKGRRGRSWISPEGGIWFTYILNPALARENYPLYTLMSAIAIIKVLEEEKVEAKIKWPNDIILEDKKLAGIAIDLVSKDRDYLVIGIGINVYNAVIDTGINLALIKQELDMTEFFIKFFNQFKYYTKLLEQDYHQIIELWRKHNNVLGEEVSIYPADGSQAYCATALDIEEDGSLLVKYNNTLRRIIAADVSLRISKQGG